MRDFERDPRREADPAAGHRRRAPTPLDDPTVGAPYLASNQSAADRGSIQRAIAGVQAAAGNAAATRAYRSGQNDRAGQAASAAGAGPITAQRDTDSFSLDQSAATPFLSPAPTRSSFMDQQADQAAPAPAAPSAPLTKDERVELTRLTGNRITRAFTAFSLAVEQNRAAIKATASESSGFIEILLEIALGALLPAISKGIARIAEELPANASNLSYRIALQAMKEEQTKKLLELGVKFGREYIKSETVALAGEDEVDEFLNGLEDKFNVSADKIDQGLPALPDQALGVLAAAYDPRVAGQEHFRGAVKSLVAKYRRQVKPIGTTDYRWGNKQSNFGLSWVVSPSGSKRLALLENNDLKEWIAPELRDTAIEKFKSTPAGRFYGGKVPEVEAKYVGNLTG